MRDLRHWILAALFAFAAPVRAQQELIKADSRPHVHVHCERLDLVHGLPVRALHVDSLRGGLVPSDDKPVLMSDGGNADVPVDPGQYVFEVLGVQSDGTVVSVHSSPVAVSVERTVTIPVAPPQPIAMFDVGRPMQVEQLALRSVAVCDEARWQRHAAGDVARIVLSPHQVCSSNVIASLGDKHVAAWLPVGEKISPQLHVKQDWNRCSFRLRSGTPPLKSASVHVVFPAGEMQFSLEPTTQLITNRRFMMFGYTANLRTDEAITFQPAGRSIGPLEQLQFGGELTPRAWMAFQWPEDGGDSVRQFVWRADLLDDGGLNADIYPKETGISWTLHDVHGTPIRDGLYANAEVTAVGDVPQKLRCDMRWTWGRTFARTIPVEPYTNVRSEHFLFSAVPAWDWETRNYLTKLERYYRVEQKATGRAGFASSQIYWRDHTYNAKALVGNPGGGDSGLWCSFPFRGYEDNHDPFTEPQFVGHELLHNFGYEHGDAMAGMQAEVERLFADYRWYMQDHPAEPITLVPAAPNASP